ncbi:MAG: M56 family metallopeptidase [Imperialibacter sp.]
MTNLLLFLFQSVACSLAFYAIYYAVLRNESCYAFNRYYLLLSVVFALIFPVISYSSPLAVGDAAFSDLLLADIYITGYAPRAANLVSGVLWMWIIYGTGLLFFTTRFGIKLVSVIELLNRAEKEIRHGYLLVRTGGELPTFSFLNYLFWDDSRTLEGDEEEQMLAHELAHIQKRHTLDVLFMEFMHAIMWFNPFIYLIKSALTMTHEFQADDRATEGKDIEVYQRLLAKQVLSQYGLALVSHFNHSQTLERLKMLANKKVKVYWAKLMLPVMGFAMVFGVISCENAGREDELPMPGNLPGDVYAKVDKMPVSDGGMATFYQHIGKNVQYPQAARKENVQGKVFVQFVVDKEGNITDVQVIKGLGGGLDEEVIKVVQSSPKWLPGSQNGKNVNVRMILPITFKLG